MKRIALILAMLMLAPVGAASAQSGGASFYASGKKTSSGERFNPHGMTAAHRSLPFGTRVRVSCPKTGKSVTVRINDRGPFVGGRIIDLAKGAAKVLGIVSQGHARVHVAVLGRKS